MRPSHLSKRGLTLSAPVLLITGLLWLWSPENAMLLAVHGTFAIVFLLAFGGAIESHVRRVYKVKRRRISGWLGFGPFLMAVVTTPLLYYSGDEVWRTYYEWLHIAGGTVGTAAFLIHLVTFRKSA